MDFLPISVRVTDCNILIVGGGKVATHKAQILHLFTDKATVIAPEVSDEMRQLPFRIMERSFEDSDLKGVQLLFICTGDHALNHHIKEVAHKYGILASVCDDPAWCDFISPAISHEEDDNLTIAVGSDAKDVKRSIRVRNRINELIKENKLDIR